MHNPPSTPITGLTAFLPLLAILSGPAFAATYYVNNAPTGCGGSGCSNSNPGTSEAVAFASPQGCINRMSGGDTCLIMDGGTPYIGTTPGGQPYWDFCALDGSPAAYTTVKNYPGHTPVFCGNASCTALGSIFGCYDPKGASYFRLEGLHIYGGLTFHGAESDHVTITGNVLELSGGDGDGNQANIRVDFVTGMQIDHNHFRNFSDGGGGDSSAAVLKFYCTHDITFEYNTVDTTGSSPSQTEHTYDIKAGSSDHVIRYNHFIGPDSNGVNPTLRTGAIRYPGVCGNNVPGSHEIYGNLFYKTRIWQSAWDLNTTMHHNTLAAVSFNSALSLGQDSGGEGPGFTDGTTIRDNYLHGVTSAHLTVHDDIAGDEFPGQYTMTNNVYSPGAPFTTYPTAGSYTLAQWKAHFPGIESESVQTTCSVDSNYNVTGGACLTASSTGGEVGYGGVTNCVGHLCGDGGSPLAACADGADNDGDALADFPADPGCLGADDTSELGTTACDNGTDDDGDGAADTADPGCTGPADVSELGLNACDDGADNDGDGQIDYPDDPGCTSVADGSENDACNDGIDNDGDGAIDHPNDPGCSSPSDASELGAIACDNGTDDDGDGLIDSAADPGCTGPGDASELGALACDDGADNDGDTLVDSVDPGCTGPTDADELGTVECDDGVDNDGDGVTDYPDDPSCASPAGASEAFSALDCDNPDPEWLVCDDFEDGTLNYWSVDLNSAGGALSVVSEPAEGNLHARMSYGQGNSAWGMRWFADHPLLTPPGAAVAEISVRLRLRYSNVNGSDIMATAAFQGWSADYPGGTPWAPYLVNLRTDATGAFEILLENRTSGSEVETVYVQNVGSTPVVAQPGTWHEVEYHLRLNTPGSADGVLDVWVDDVKTISRQDVNFRGSYTERGWNTMMLRAWDGDIPAGGYMEDIDNVVTAVSHVDTSTGPPPPPGTIRKVVCGDGNLDAPEVCDGDLLGGASCQTLDFAGGNLACALDCSSFDTSQCF